ncbi:MAG TPA: LEA type 2 family protein [Gemmatimonadaceae bacterium]|nr:LEA type 2 family protein [Gemmatimonadaceae bacterium]
MRPSASLALVALLALAACREAAERVFKPPQAEFRGVRIGGIGVGGASLEVALAVRNPNAFRLTATGATYRLLVEDSVEVGRGATTDTFTVAARDSATVRLPLDVEWAALQRAVRGAAGDGQVEYRIVGEIRADTPVGTYPVALDARGRARVPRL